MRKVEQFLKTMPSRRSFLAGAGAAGAATLVVGCSDSVTPFTNATPAPTPTLTIPDNDILNFALNLEYLEAEFYLRAATGKGVPTADGGSASVNGGAVVPGLTAMQSAYINELAQTELDHVRALRTAISGNSGTPVASPSLDFTNAFNALATAAGIGATFNPFSSSDAFLVGAFIFEDVGVTAYKGAAPLLTSTALLQAAASIMATEAYHAGSIRTRLVKNASLADSTYVDYANKIVALRAALGGGNETALSQTTIVPHDSNALAYGRTTSQVLHIVYGTGGGAGVSKGGFFPNGLNGNITTTAS